MFKRAMINLGNVKDTMSSKIGDVKFAVSVNEKVPTNFDDVLAVKDRTLNMLSKKK